MSRHTIQGVRAWGSDLRPSARGFLSRPVSAHAYNVDRLQGRNQRRAYIGRHAPPGPSSLKPYGAPIASVSWSRALPPDVYNRGRLQGRNRRVAVVGRPKTSRRPQASLAIDSDAATAEQNRATELAEAAGGKHDPAEIVAGLKAARAMVTDDADKDMLDERIAAITPFVLLAKKRPLTEDEQAAVDEAGEAVLAMARDLGQREAEASAAGRIAVAEDEAQVAAQREAVADAERQEDVAHRAVAQVERDLDAQGRALDAELREIEQKVVRGAAGAEAAARAAETARNRLVAEFKDLETKSVQASDALVVVRDDAKRIAKQLRSAKRAVKSASPKKSRRSSPTKAQKAQIAKRRERVADLEAEKRAAELRRAAIEKELARLQTEAKDALNDAQDAEAELAARDGDFRDARDAVQAAQQDDADRRRVFADDAKAELKLAEDAALRATANRATIDEPKRTVTKRSDITTKPRRRARERSRRKQAEATAQAVARLLEEQAAPAPLEVKREAAPARRTDRYRVGTDEDVQEAFARTPDYNDWTAPTLRRYLQQLGVSFARTAGKQILIGKVSGYFTRRALRRKSVG